MGPNSTGSLPRRDKAGLGRPEPVVGQATIMQNGQRRRDSSLNRDNGRLGPDALISKGE